MTDSPEWAASQELRKQLQEGPIPPPPPPPHMHEDDGTVEGCPGCMYDIAHLTADAPDAPEDSPVVLARVLSETIWDLVEHAKQAHEHSWDIQDAQAAPEPAVRMPMVPIVATTYVLMRCVHCGKPESKPLMGTWTLAQLRADAFADERRALLAELGAMPAAALTALLAPYRRLPAE